MDHAILGSGGVGGLLGAALARAGHNVVLIMRPETLREYKGTLTVESRVLGDFVIDVPAAPRVPAGIDALWVATKNTQLVSALHAASPADVGPATVVPFLNGVDHVDVLRARYPAVVPGTMRVESERVGVDVIEQRSPFLRTELAGAPELVDALVGAGIDCRLRDDELSMLWEKLVLLAPLALATTALGSPLGGVRHDTRYLGCEAEAVAVAKALGARIDEPALETMRNNAPDTMRSSMQRDVEALRTPELDAIAGPILRGGKRHGIPTPATAALVKLIEAAG
jgi:2-dehydropantoate 2-reductase